MIQVENPQTLNEFHDYLKRILNQFASDNYLGNFRVNVGAEEQPPFFIWRFRGDIVSEQIDEYLNITWRYEVNFVNDDPDVNIAIAVKLKNLLASHKIGARIESEGWFEAKQAYALRVFVFYA